MLQKGQNYTLSQGAQWWEERQCAQNETQEVLNEHEEKNYLLGESLSTRSVYPERLWSLILEVFKSHLEIGPCNLFWVSLFEQCWTRWPPEVHQTLIILWFHLILPTNNKIKPSAQEQSYSLQMEDVRSPSQTSNHARSVFSVSRRNPALLIQLYFLKDVKRCFFLVTMSFCSESIHRITSIFLSHHNCDFMEINPLAVGAWKSAPA